MLKAVSSIALVTLAAFGFGSQADQPFVSVGATTGKVKTIS